MILIDCFANQTILRPTETIVSIIFFQVEEAAQREAKIKERSKSISVLREAERNELLRVHAANVVERGNDIEDREQEEIERRERSEILRRQRSQVCCNCMFKPFTLCQVV